MDIDRFISGITLQGQQCSLASPGFTSYYQGLFRPLGQLTGEEFAICSVLNFSAQQLSNRTARNPVEHRIAHFTNVPKPFFSATILKLVGYTEVHFLPICECQNEIFESIQRNLELNNSTEVRGPYLHRSPAIETISGHFGLVQLVEATKIPSLELIATRLARFTDIVAVAQSLSQLTDSLRPLEYTPFVQATIGTRQIAVFRRTRLPAPGKDLEV